MSALSSPLVSVVIPFYNQGDYIYEAALSAKFAYSGPIDIVIVNDGSTEPGICRKLAELCEAINDDRCSVNIVHQENRGLPVARNTGISVARGDFIQLLDSDDILLFQKIDHQLNHFAIAPRLDVSVADCLFTNASLDSPEYHDDLVGGVDYTLDDFLFKWERGFSIPIHSALFRRAIFDKHRFNETVKAKEDWIFWTRLVASGGRISFIGLPLAIYRVHDSSMCRNMPALGQQWLRAANEIETMLTGLSAGFMNAAIEWHSKVYLAGGDVSSAAASSTDDSHGVAAATDVLTNARLTPLSLPAIGAGELRLSVVIPVFNHYDYLARCLNSLAVQEGDDFEVVIVNDASTDPRVIQLLSTIPEGMPNIIVMHNASNVGVVQTQTRAIKACKGEYIAFVDCDDALPRGALRQALTFIDQNGGCDYFFSDRFDVDEFDNVLRVAHYGGYDDNRFTGEFKTDILNGMIASHLKIVRRTNFEKVDGFDQGLSGVQDWELALKVADFGKFIYLPEPLYCHRIHAKSITKRDVRGQFHRTNIVRRRFASRLLGVDEKQRRAHGAETTFCGDDRVEAPDLAAAWKAGSVILDTTGGISQKNLWHYREFNSYFDMILWRSADVYAAFLGYVWSPDILRQIDPVQAISLYRDADIEGLAVHLPDE